MAKTGDGENDSEGLEFNLPMVSQRAGDVYRKRKEQLQRWEDSETNRLPPRRPKKKVGVRAVGFPEGCVFMAACASGDEEEVEELLGRGADINTTNVDGLTALHQAVIDENMEMVRFLLTSGADVNAQDNEGWTALHAAVSCGFVELADVLLANGASLAIPNNDGELPSDLSDDSEHAEPIKALLSREVRRTQVDLEAARRAEESMMMRDARRWATAGRMPSGAELRSHPRTGATPLHVAAAKGYTDILRLLLQAGADPEWRDQDGWTALHASAHWGEKEAAKMLAEAGADFQAKSLAGQTPLEVCEEGLGEWLADLERSTATQRAPKVAKLSPALHPADPVIHAANVTTRRKNSIPRLSTEDKHAVAKTDEAREAKTLRTASEEEAEEDEPPVAKDKTVSKTITTTQPTSTPSVKVSVSIPAAVTRPAPPSYPPPPLTEKPKLGTTPPPSPTLRKPDLTRPTTLTTTITTPTAPTAPSGKENGLTLKMDRASPQAVKFRGTAPLPSTSAPATRTTNGVTSPLLSPSASANHIEAPTPPSWRLTGKRVDGSNPLSPSNSSSGFKSETPEAKKPQTTSATPQPPKPDLSKPLASFTPPYRPESEAERKAHSRKQRESRRSTQGVTLEQLKSAQEMIETPARKVSEPASLNPPPEPPPRREQRLATVSHPSAGPTSPTSPTPLPTWRSVALESNTPKGKAEEAPPSFATSIAGITNRATRGLPVDETGAPEKEPAHRTRRIRKDRRSTGPVAAQDLDDAANEEKEEGPTLHPPVPSSPRAIPNTPRITHLDGPPTSVGYGNRYSGTNGSSRVSSATSLHSTDAAAITDYKLLYEREKAEREKLGRRVAELEDTVADLKRSPSDSTRGRTGLAGLGERERAKWEQRVADLEDDVKEIEKLRADNVRLKDENGALIRVISKLSK